MSLPSIELQGASCPECGKGTLARVVVSKTYTVEGQAVQVDGLLPFQCSACQAFIWPNAEVQRARQVIAIKLGKKAA